MDPIPLKGILGPSSAVWMWNPRTVMTEFTSHILLDRVFCKNSLQVTTSWVFKILVCSYIGLL